MIYININKLLNIKINKIINIGRWRWKLAARNFPTSTDFAMGIPFIKFSNSRVCSLFQLFQQFLSCLSCKTWYEASEKSMQRFQQVCMLLMLRQNTINFLDPPNGPPILRPSPPLAKISASKVPKKLCDAAIE